MVKFVGEITVKKSKSKIFQLVNKISINKHDMYKKNRTVYVFNFYEVWVKLIESYEQLNSWLSIL